MSLCILSLNSIKLLTLSVIRCKTVFSGTKSLTGYASHSLTACTHNGKFCLRRMATDRVKDLNYDDIVNLSSKNEIFVIDVRNSLEIQETGKLPGSTHIPLGDLPSALSLPDDAFKEKYGINKPASDAQLVFSCRSGKRSLTALNKALELGFINSRHYAGGWLDWESKTKN